MKHGLSLLVISLIFCTPQGWAADQSAKPVPTMGRLFFSPNDRASLDNIRQNSKAPDKIIKAEETNKIDQPIEDETAISKQVSVKGYVSRSDGKNTVWVNDKAMSEKSSTRDIAVGKLQKNSGQVEITLLGVEKSAISLKAGQIYDPASGKIYNYSKDVPASVASEEKPQSVMKSITDVKNKVMDAFSFLTDPENTHKSSK